ncbi:MAG: hypothetical protein HY377_00415 [Candidatus Blackburnbacteria bacterium]|nr:hypothetical protein [Candidatus Blackburnbacteria bacterium]
MNKLLFNETTKHLPHYLSLIGVAGAFLWGFIAFSYDKAFQSALTLALGISFIVWGIVHHFIHDDLHPRVVLEYIMSAALGTVVLLAVIWNA